MNANSNSAAVSNKYNHRYVYSPKRAKPATNNVGRKNRKPKKQRKNPMAIQMIAATTDWGATAINEQEKGRDERVVRSRQSKRCYRTERYIPSPPLYTLFSVRSKSSYGLGSDFYRCR